MSSYGTQAVCGLSVLRSGFVSCIALSAEDTNNNNNNNNNINNNNNNSNDNNMVIKIQYAQF